MGAMLWILLAAIFVGLLVRCIRCKKTKKHITIAMCASGFVVCLLLVWYYFPTVCDLPKNPAYQKYDAQNVWYDDETEIMQITGLLEKFMLQRDSRPTQGLAPVDRVFPDGIDANEWMIIAIYDNDIIENKTPKLWGYCSVFLSQPDASRIICKDEGVLGHYRILNIDSFIEELTKMSDLWMYSRS